MNRRVFVSGEAHEANFARALRFRDGFDDPSRCEVSFRVVVIDAFVDLPMSAPPTPMIETSTPVRPNGRRGISLVARLLTSATALLCEETFCRDMIPPATSAPAPAPVCLMNVRLDV